MELVAELAAVSVPVPRHPDLAVLFWITRNFWTEMQYWRQLYKRKWIGTKISYKFFIKVCFCVCVSRKRKGPSLESEDSQDGPPLAQQQQPPPPGPRQSGSMVSHHDDIVTRMKNIEMIEIGAHRIKPWYFAPYPQVKPWHEIYKNIFYWYFCRKW